MGELKKIEKLIIGLLLTGFFLVSMYVSILPASKEFYAVKRNEFFIIGSPNFAFMTPNRSGILSRRISDEEQDYTATIKVENLSVSSISGLSNNISMNYSYVNSPSGFEQTQSGGSSSQSANVLLAAGGRKSQLEQVMSSSGGSSVPSLSIMSSPFAAPQAAQSVAAITGGGDPGLAPLGLPLPVGDGLIVLLILAVVYLFFQNKYRFLKI